MAASTGIDEMIQFIFDHIEPGNLEMELKTPGDTPSYKMIYAGEQYSVEYDGERISVIATNHFLEVPNKLISGIKRVLFPPEMNIDADTRYFNKKEATMLPIDEHYFTISPEELKIPYAKLSII